MSSTKVKSEILISPDLYVDPIRYSGVEKIN